MQSRFLGLALAAAVVLPALACSGGGGTSNPASSPIASPTNPAGSPVATGTPLSDEAYLRVICTGTQNFSDALMSQSSPEGIAKSVRDFISSLQGVNPPADLRPFHESLLGYLQDSVDNPLELATKPRPEPEEDVRQRLAAKETGIAECEKAKYFTTSP
jgi:hypothetical protein